MCGIIGFLDKTQDGASVGKVVLQMLNALGARGPDSAGVALYGQKTDKGMVAQIKLGKQKEAAFIVEQLEEFGLISEVKIVAEYLRLVISLEVDTASFLKFVESVRELEVPDPYYGGPAGFEHVLDLIDEASRGLLEMLKQKNSLDFE